ncbi:HPr kinase/phosphorylase [Butyrivibrio sp. VCB2006]|uniref:HPr kinase/phosphorylase n=1 Tax=Butyrivibrio sp. VCB2006 TaxID=1280679 RepID=UPI0003FEE2B0|nr:hypothetical protein [Butyrivibrio sp. VCB2006]
MEKHYYKIYGLTLASDYEFPQFVSIEKNDKEPDIIIEHGDISEEIKLAADKGQICDYGKKELWFNNQTGYFWIRENKISFLEKEDVSVDDAAQFLPGMCLAILLWFHENIMLHGACIRIDDKTIVIAGNSGSGKSTLMTELIKKGAKLIADDVTCIRQSDGRYLSYPAFPAQKLCLDQIENNNISTDGLRQVRYDLNKYEIPRNEEFFDEPSEVNTLFRVEVGNCEELEMSKIDGAEKIKVVTDSIFIEWLFNQEFRVEPEDLLRCLGFASGISIHRIIRNKEKNTLDSILEYILNNID